MEQYTCEECGGSFGEEDLDQEALSFGDYYCIQCSEQLSEDGWDAVDPDHNFDSFSDWDERGH